MTAPTPILKDRLLDVLERAGTSAGEQFFAVVTASGAVASLAGLPWVAVLSTAAGAFLVSALTSAGFVLAGIKAMPFWADLSVRAVRVFAASLLASLGASAVNVLHVPWHSELNIAAVATVLAVVKGLLSPNAHLSASLLPTPVVARLHGVDVTSGTFKPAV